MSRGPDPDLYPWLCHVLLGGCGHSEVSEVPIGERPCPECGQVGPFWAKSVIQEFDLEEGT